MKQKKEVLTFAQAKAKEEAERKHQRELIRQKMEFDKLVDAEIDKLLFPANVRKRGT
ncbi:MAG: hypothetical protein FWF81_03745 [Defluviitaleaceae bacterium]|nr:hypothetical protein [Defluviitaleaceae bacterium]